jgi:hypothetical protein
MPRSPRNLAVAVGAPNLTHYGGVYLLHRFLSRIGFKDAVAVRALHDRFLQRLTLQPRPPTRLIFDVDSTVLVV